MKKTLAAVAVLGAFAGSAFAADVTLYGRVDAGLNYTHQSVDGEKSTDDFSMKSGQYTGSRFGVKGSEQISEDLTVSFQLEHGFSIDSGKFSDSDRMFNREARLSVTTPFGEFGFGRMGGIDSGLGTYDLVGGASPWGTGWGDYTGSMDAVFKGLTTRYDNMITYKSPTFAGLTVIAQASLKQDTDADGDEGSHLADRYYALGVDAEYGAFAGALTYSMQDYAGLADRYTGWGHETNKVTKDNSNDSDGYTVTAFGSYDFGVTKVSLGAQYFDNVAQERGSLKATYTVGTETHPEADWKYGDVEFGLTGYGLILGAVTPMFGGNLYTSVGYADYEQSTTDTGKHEDTAKLWNVSVGYDYALSKRTKLYTAVSYTALTENEEEADSKDVDTNTTEVMAGIVHYF
ncbi:porin [Parasutterella secunda]|uniref:porin n=1 Tax=Parasutterella secunda TaxID=626947 RepID=UPI0025A37C4C|nr:porin [Parasutterella secunda]MDM8217417.1 porin [Parasutterella secunda]